MASSRNNTRVTLPERAPLTRDELEALPNGTAVIVLWSGGNGPHRYVIEQRPATTYAQIPADPHGPYRWENPLVLVGAERYHTKVWLDG